MNWLGLGRQDLGWGNRKTGVIAGVAGVVDFLGVVGVLGVLLVVGVVGGVGVVGLGVGFVWWSG